MPALPSARLCGDGVDQRRADHDAIGVAPDDGGVFGGLDAEADRDRQVGVRLDAPDRLADRGAVLDRRRR